MVRLVWVTIFWPQNTSYIVLVYYLSLFVQYPMMYFFIAQTVDVGKYHMLLLPSVLMCFWIISTHVDANDITAILKPPSHSGSFTLSLYHRGNLPELMKTLVTLNPHLLHNIFVLNHTVCSPELPAHETFLSVLWLCTSGCLANLLSGFLGDTLCASDMCLCDC